MNRKPKIIAVAGPTASGKTSLAIALSERFTGEVVSFDSMQIYTHLDIGTAKPDDAERGAVPHHLIDCIDPRRPFSCADFVPACEGAVQDVLARGALPVLCGGTGLYLDSFLRGTDALAPAAHDASLSASLREEAERAGIEPLYRRLTALDPEAAAAIHPNNTRRVLRALEICILTGGRKSEFDRLSKEQPCRYDCLLFVIDFHNREVLHRRIAVRTEAMFRMGLFEETKRLYETGMLPSDATASQAIGYRQIIGVLQNGGTAADAQPLVEAATRQYAKRQMTWFRREANRVVIYADSPGGDEDKDEMTREAIRRTEAFLREEATDNG